MGARGATAASEAADVVIVEDSIKNLATAVLISKGARNRALQAAGVGMGPHCAQRAVSFPANRETIYSGPRFRMNSSTSSSSGQRPQAGQREKRFLCLNYKLRTHRAALLGWLLLFVCHGANFTSKETSVFG